MADNDFHYGAKPELFYFARLNRQAHTEAENILWEALRNRRLNGYKFRRQHPLGEFIADFYCDEAKLVIEVDGAHHLDQEHLEYDNERTFLLTEFGIKVIRFSNDEVLTMTDLVLEKILKQIV